MRTLFANGDPCKCCICLIALGSIERINTDAEGYGGSLQAASKAELFGRPNRFVVGAIYDGAKVQLQYVE